MKFITALIGSVSAITTSSYEDYPHAHVEYGEKTLFRDVDVIYQETEYSIGHKTKTEVRNRQVPHTSTYTQTETKYREDTEIRNTK